jgi:hypothetical protein
MMRLTTLLVVAMLAFAGCGGDDDTTGSEPAAQATSTQEPESASGGEEGEDGEDAGSDDHVPAGAHEGDRLRDGRADGRPPARSDALHSITARGSRAAARRAGQAGTAGKW